MMRTSNDPCRMVRLFTRRAKRRCINELPVEVLATLMYFVPYFRSEHDMRTGSKATTAKSSQELASAQCFCRWDLRLVCTHWLAVVQNRTGDLSLHIKAKLGIPVSKATATVSRQRKTVINSSVLKHLVKSFLARYSGVSAITLNVQVPDYGLANESLAIWMNAAIAQLSSDMPGLRNATLTLALQGVNAKHYTANIKQAKPIKRLNFPADAFAFASLGLRLTFDENAANGNSAILPFLIEILPQLSILDIPAYVFKALAVQLRDGFDKLKALVIHGSKHRHPQNSRNIRMLQLVSAMANSFPGIETLVLKNCAPYCSHDFEPLLNLPRLRDLSVDLVECWSNHWEHWQCPLIRSDAENDADLHLHSAVVKTLKLGLPSPRWWRMLAATDRQRLTETTKALMRTCANAEELELSQLYSLERSHSTALHVLTEQLLAQHSLDHLRRLRLNFAWERDAESSQYWEARFGVLMRLLQVKANLLGEISIVAGSCHIDLLALLRMIPPSVKRLNFSRSLATQASEANSSWRGDDEFFEACILPVLNATNATTLDSLFYGYVCDRKYMYSQQDFMRGDADAKPLARWKRDGPKKSLRRCQEICSDNLAQFDVLSCTFDVSVMETCSFVILASDSDKRHEVRVQIDHSNCYHFQKLEPYNNGGGGGTWLRSNTRRDFAKPWHHRSKRGHQTGFKLSGVGI